MPPKDGKAPSATEGNLIMHVSLPISQETILVITKSISNNHYMREN